MKPVGEGFGLPMVDFYEIGSGRRVFWRRRRRRRRSRGKDS
jgi:hypothetical protein